MHPLLEHTERLRLYLGAWVVVAVFLAGLLTLYGGVGFGYALVLTLPMGLVYAFACLSALYFCRAFPFRKNALILPIGASLLAASLSSALWILAGRVLISSLAASPAFGPLETWYISQTPLLVCTGALLFLIALLVHYLVMETDNARIIEKQAMEFERLAREAELRALKAQINPHFLFNSLNSISALTASNAVAARDMCLHLAEFYRSTLKFGRLREIPLREELALTEAFLAIEQQRFGSRLRFEKDIAEDAAPCMVPPLFLQPLVENAITHGIAHLLEGGTIRLHIRSTGRWLEIHLENPFDPADPPRDKGGFGLVNVRDRLSMFYGKEARMSVQRRSGVFEVTLEMPARREELPGGSDVS